MHRIAPPLVPLTAMALLAISTSTGAQTPESSQTQATESQIVRLSLVEGDVRVSRGKAAEHAGGGVWGEAAKNLPIESGFSLVTGTGRAEIEFEDTSTVYLGENSVLLFNQLTTAGNVPQSELTLVSGTATLHVRPAVPGESFSLTTPNARLSTGYGAALFTRVDSYLDATEVTPQEDISVHVDSPTATKLIVGQTTTYYADRRIVNGGASRGELTAWDAWAAKRLAARSAAMSATLKESGLATPIPGLAELKGKGTFFDCAPYGTCWQPNGGWSGQEKPAAPPTTQPAIEGASYRTLGQSWRQIGWQTGAPKVRLLQAAQFQTGFSGSGPDQGLNGFDDEFAGSFFPCSPYQFQRFGSQLDLFGGGFGLGSYDWALCHAGSWIQRQNQYVWVAGLQLHRRSPVSWVKYGHTTAYVPIHPSDVAGRPPLNLQHGVFTFNGKQGESVQRVAFSPATPVKVLDSGPKQFRSAFYTPLQPAAAPQPIAHIAGPAPSSIAAGKQLASRPVGTPITFDHKTQSFVMVRPLVVGGQTAMATQRFGGQVEAAGNGTRSGAISTVASSHASPTSSSAVVSSGVSRSAAVGASGGGASHASAGGSAHH